MTPVTTRRIRRGIRSITRIPEVLQAFLSFTAPCRTTLRYLLPSGGAYPMTVSTRDGMTFSLEDWSELTTLWHIYAAAEYRVPPDARIIVDLGANFGAFTLYALGRAPKSHVLALEPFPTTFTRLKDTVAGNGLTPRTTLRQMAVSADAATAHLTADANGHSYARHIVGPNSTGRHTIDVATAV